MFMKIENHYNYLLYKFPINSRTPLRLIKQHITNYFLTFRLNDAYGGRPVITYRDLDAPREGDEY